MTRPTLIRTLNALYLAVVFLLVPWIASKRFGNYQILSHPAWQTLTLWGLGLGCLANLLGAITLAKRKQTRKTHLRWTAIHATLLLAEYFLFTHR